MCSGNLGCHGACRLVRGWHGLCARRVLSIHLPTSPRQFFRAHTPSSSFIIPPLTAPSCSLSTLRVTLSSFAPTPPISLCLSSSSYLFLIFHVLTFHAIRLPAPPTPAAPPSVSALLSVSRLHWLFTTAHPSSELLCCESPQGRSRCDEGVREPANVHTEQFYFSLKPPLRPQADLFGQGVSFFSHLPVCNLQPLFPSEPNVIMAPTRWRKFCQVLKPNSQPGLFVCLFLVF